MSAPTLLHYRNGFILHPKAQPIPVADSWVRHPLDDTLTLSCHPATQVWRFARDGRQLVAIGEGFDPETGLYKSKEAFQALFDAHEDETRFLDQMDRMAGRFALLSARPGKGWQVYHDALGSRAVFYDHTRLCVASHVDLIARTYGLSHAEFFVPFLTSPNYISRDVKYLPGVATPYAEIRQLSPNTRLDLPSNQVSRYWPRAPHDQHDDYDGAVAALIGHMEGLAHFIEANGLKVQLGLTGGYDSRCLLAGLARLDPYLFTYVRSDKGTIEGSADARMAQRLAKAVEKEADIWPIRNRMTLNQTETPVSRAFRAANGGCRGNGAPWLFDMMKHNDAYDRTRFIRGSGGEILRGFYQTTSKALTRVNTMQLSDLYGVNAGSHVTRRLFDEFITLADFTPDRMQGLDPNDMFYWEHRMGIWGSLALTEADIAAQSLPGYNSRNLFAKFMTLPWTDRYPGRPFRDTARHLAPALAGIPIL